VWLNKYLRYFFSYLYKYLFKGPDRTMFSLSEVEVDEISDYINARYLSASEAMWRIFQWDITSKTPAVKSLHVHLQSRNLHQMYSKDNSESGGTDLLRYFVRPIDPIFDDLLYTQYYVQFRQMALGATIPNNGAETTWLEQTCVGFLQMRVVGRCRERPIARRATVSPRTGDLYYCRALLQHKAARSFVELQTHDEIVYPTFQEAAQAMGLFEDRSEAFQTLQEAVELFCSPCQLRFMFGYLIINSPHPAVNLFIAFQEQLSADHMDRTQNAPLALQFTLKDIASALISQSAKLSDFGLPNPEENVDELLLEDAIFEDRRSELLELSETQIQNLLPEQKLAFQAVISAVCGNEFGTSNLQEDREGTNCFFLEGKSGRGKTYTVNAIINQLRGRESIVLVCGSTALSVTLYERGRTAHNLFGIPVTEVSCTI
jgi:hypothetical protein